MLVTNAATAAGQYLEAARGDFRVALEMVNKPGEFWERVRLLLPLRAPTGGGAEFRMTELCQCAMLECRQQREAFALTRARKAEQPEPEYDWEDLEKQSTRARRHNDQRKGGER